MDRRRFPPILEIPLLSPYGLRCAWLRVTTALCGFGGIICALAKWKYGDKGVESVTKPAMRKRGGCAAAPPRQLRETVRLRTVCKTLPLIPVMRLCVPLPTSGLSSPLSYLVRGLENTPQVPLESVSLLYRRSSAQPEPRRILSTIPRASRGSTGVLHFLGLRAWGYCAAESGQILSTLSSAPEI